MILAPKAVEAEIAEKILGLLSGADEPLAVTKLAQQAPPLVRKQKKLLGPILEELVDEGRVYRFPPYRSKQPRYWTRNLSHYARTLIVTLLTEKGPSKPADVGKPIKSRLKDWPKEELVSLLNSLIREGAVRELPPLGRTKVKRLSLDPPQPREYLEKVFTLSLVKPLRKVIDLLHQEGAAAEQLLTDANVIWQETLFKLEPFAALMTPSNMDGQAGRVSSLISNAEQAASSHQQTEARPTPRPEAVVQGMLALKPNAANGAMVALPDLRNFLRETFPTKQVFDQAVLQLAGEGRVDLHRHTFPSSLDELEKAALVTDERGNYYIGIVLRK